MTPEQVAVYRKHRAQGLSALQARNMLKPTQQTIRPELAKFGQYGNTKAKWEQDGYTVRAEIVDDYSEMFGIGRYVDRWEPGVITRRNPGRHEYKYFLPEQTEEQHYKSLRAMHYGKALARELAHSYVRQDYKRAESYGQEWGYQGVEVTV